MINLLFACLLLLGSALAGLLIMISEHGMKTKAVVQSSSCELEREESQIIRLSLLHCIKLEEKEGALVRTTDTIPVRESDGTCISVKYNKKTDEFVKNYSQTFLPVIISMALTGFFLAALFFLQTIEPEFLQELGNKAYLSFFLIGTGLYFLSTGVVFLHPGYIKAKSRFEGILYVPEKHRYCEIYSLWYGEHQQYGICSMNLFAAKHAAGEVLVYFNMKSGEIRKKADMLFNVCLGLIFCSIGILLLL